MESAIDTSRMEKAFSFVEPKGDWRAPISATVKAHELKAAGLDIGDVVEAVSFYTATAARVTCLCSGDFHVRAIGYRNGPAGP